MRCENHLAMILLCHELFQNVQYDCQTLRVNPVLGLLNEQQAWWLWEVQNRQKSQDQKHAFRHLVRSDVVSSVDEFEKDSLSPSPIQLWYCGAGIAGVLECICLLEFDRTNLWKVLAEPPFKVFESATPISQNIVEARSQPKSRGIELERLL